MHDSTSEPALKRLICKSSWEFKICPPFFTIQNICDPLESQIDQTSVVTQIIKQFQKYCLLYIILNNTLISCTFIGE